MTGFKYYFSWFMRYFIVMFIIHFLCSIIFVGVLPVVPFYIPFITFIFFDILLIIQNFFIQVFLTRSKIGVVISLLFFLVQFILSFIATNSDNPTIGVNTAISVVPHAAFVLAFRTMLFAQSVGTTPTFSGTLNNYTIGTAILSFFINIIVYLILTWYLDQVVPNEWGAKRHPLFCCFEDTSTITREEKEIRKNQILNQPGYHDKFEEIDETLKREEQSNRAIEIVTLRK